MRSAGVQRERDGIEDYLAACKPLASREKDDSSKRRYPSPTRSPARSKAALPEPARALREVESLAFICSPQLQ